MSNNEELFKSKRSIISRETMMPLGIVVAVVLGVWSLRGAIADFQESLNLQLNTVSKQLDFMDKSWKYHIQRDWTQSDMERWSYLLEKSNRRTCLVVPDPNMVKSTRSDP